MLAFSNLVLDHPEHEHVSAAGTRVFNFNLERAKKLAEKLGVECIYFPQIPFPYLEQPAPDIREGERWGCPEAWRALIVEKDGNLKPCCYLNNSFGNSKDGDLADMLNNDKAVEFRKTFTERKYLNTCKGCGQFYRITDEATEETLGKVESLLKERQFSEPTRILLEEKLAYFRALFQESQTKASSASAA